MKTGPIYTESTPSNAPTYTKRRPDIHYILLYKKTKHLVADNNSIHSTSMTRGGPRHHRILLYRRTNNC